MGFSTSYQNSGGRFARVRSSCFRMLAMSLQTRLGEICYVHDLRDENILSANQVFYDTQSCSVYFTAIAISSSSSSLLISFPPLYLKQYSIFTSTTAFTISSSPRTSSFTKLLQTWRTRPIKERSNYAPIGAYQSANLCTGTAFEIRRLIWYTTPTKVEF